MERKQKMETAIDPLPDHELCPYEKLREDIIKEREKAKLQIIPLHSTSIQRCMIPILTIIMIMNIFITVCRHGQVLPYS
jgi:hypothetical protein